MNLNLKTFLRSSIGNFSALKYSFSGTLRGSSEIVILFVN